MVVKMERLRNHQFHSVGADTDGVAFDIDLQECNIVMVRRLGLMFNGIVNRQNPEVLSIGEGPGIATGIGIALFDQTNNLIPLNKTIYSLNKRSIDKNTLHFVAKYRATRAHVSGGEANSQAYFSLTYP
nr:fimbrial protein [Serratia liquefaciens]